MEMNENSRSLQFVLAFGIKQLVRSVVVRFRHEDFGRTIQVTVVRRGRINKLLRRRDAVFFQHYDEHFGVDYRTGIKQFHDQN
jgi:hypothetical protein